MIFLSAVSSQFKACRDALASDLHAVGRITAAMYCACGINRAPMTCSPRL